MTKLYIEGVMNEKALIDNLHLNVYWNGNLFNVQNHKHNDEIDEQEAFELLFEVNIPPFAPSGKYVLEAIVQAQGSELGCLKASFSL